MIERTLVIAKPDAYRRGLIGALISRFERSGLELVQLRVSRDENFITESHYPRSDDWLAIVGGKTLADHQELGLSVKEKFGTEDPVEIGRSVRAWLVDFLQSGPLVPMILSGNRAVESVRKADGATLPVAASPGTIRGDFSTDSTDLAAAESRPVQNLIHASGDIEEAEREISLWFPDFS
jgi:nucleoside-diphosphate kinase